MTRAGTLRHLLTLESLATTRDGDTGAITDAWSTVTTLWASVTPISGVEEVKGQTVTHEIRTRYVSGVLPGMRLKKSTRVWLIVSVLNVEERGTDLLFKVTESL